MSVAIVRKQLDNGLETILLAVNNEQGMLVPELARILGVGQANLQHIAKRNTLTFVTLSHKTQKELRENNVIAITGRAPNFATKDTIRSLVRLVGTTEAETIYNQLWDEAESSRREVSSGFKGMDEGEALGHFRLLLQNWERTLEEKEAIAKERDEAIRTKLWISDKREATAMSTASKYARQNRTLTKENQELKIQLELNDDWKTAIAWSIAYPELKGINEKSLGRQLSALARRMGVDPRSIPDSEYHRINLYHSSVVEKYLTARSK